MPQLHSLSTSIQCQSLFIQNIFVSSRLVSYHHEERIQFSDGFVFYLFGNSLERRYILVFRFIAFCFETEYIFIPFARAELLRAQNAELSYAPGKWQECKMWKRIPLRQCCRRCRRRRPVNGFIYYSIWFGVDIKRFCWLVVLAITQSQCAQHGAWIL